MMVLYSGTTCPFSHRCRFVLFEKGMDFEIRDVDLYNKPEDIGVMNPYGQVPILVERDLILYESNIINEYIDERFPHPQRQGPGKSPGKGPIAHPRSPDPVGPGVPEEQIHVGRKLLDARCRHRPLVVAPGSLRHRVVEKRRAFAQVRRAHLLASGLHRSIDPVRKSHAQVSVRC